jgi:hypothetical protein
MPGSNRYKLHSGINRNRRYPAALFNNVLSIIPLAGLTGSAVTKNYDESNSRAFSMGGTIDKTLLVEIP